jgi:2-C-methyl-D-erythritol 4-phosphate cytidylyltransferase/2-C-methyl-D-erythritol 2,4-cyclodiphosphate synthase
MGFSGFSMSVAAIVVAAGRGSRAGAGGPKQYRRIGSRSILAASLHAFLSHPRVDLVIAVIHPDDEALHTRTLSELMTDTRRKLLPAVHGGETRQQSVFNGLAALTRQAPKTVLVHDAARPFVTERLIGDAIEAGRNVAALPGLPVTDTIKVVDGNGQVVGTPDRSTLRAVQTPQVFPYPAILEAHRAAAEAGRSGFSDDGALAEWAGIPVVVFPGDPSNTKLTHPEDFEMADRNLTPATAYVTRLGTGFDVHAFGDGDHVWLGGVRVPHERGVIAHSDGDVILHAVTDAILGALADGDIGVHFPPSDPQWKGASSDRFLDYAAERVRARGGIIDHLDVTLLCEAPRLGPYREEMRRRMAEIAGVSAAQVSLKATTTEKLGFTGRREGLAAQAAATIRMPQEAP